MRWTVCGVSEEAVNLVREVAAASGRSQGEVLNEMIPELTRRLRETEKLSDLDFDAPLADIVQALAKQDKLLIELQAMLRHLQRQSPTEYPEYRWGT